MDYLTRWRMLRDGEGLRVPRDPIAFIALSPGYELLHGSALALRQVRREDWLCTWVGESEKTDRTKRRSGCGLQRLGRADQEILPPRNRCVGRQGATRARVGAPRCRGKRERFPDRGSRQEMARREEPLADRRTHRTGGQVRRPRVRSRRATQRIDASRWGFLRARSAALSAPLR